MDYKLHLANNSYHYRRFSSNIRGFAPSNLISDQRRLREWNIEFVLSRRTFHYISAILIILSVSFCKFVL